MESASPIPPFLTISCNMPTLLERDSQYPCNIMGPDYLRCISSFSKYVVIFVDELFSLSPLLLMGLNSTNVFCYLFLKMLALLPFSVISPFLYRSMVLTG